MSGVVTSVARQGLRAWLAPGVTAPICVQCILGVAALLAIDSLLARTGRLNPSLGWIVHFGADWSPAPR